MRTVVLDAFTGQPRALHNMAELAGQTVNLSYNNNNELAYLVPATPKSCPTRYSPPISDDDQTPVQSTYPGETVYRSDGSAITVAMDVRNSRASQSLLSRQVAKINHLAFLSSVDPRDAEAAERAAVEVARRAETLKQAHTFKAVAERYISAHQTGQRRARARIS